MIYFKTCEENCSQDLVIIMYANVLKTSPIQGILGYICQYYDTMLLDFYSSQRID